jgi:hypothetical protein
MPKRVDANQPSIVDGLRKVGAEVQMLHEVGKGCPDILVGYRGKNWLMEIKNPGMPPSKRKLTEDEADWHDRWQEKGQVAIVETTLDALIVIGALRHHIITQEEINAHGMKEAEKTE